MASAGADGRTWRLAVAAEGLRMGDVYGHGYVRLLITEPGPFESFEDSAFYFVVDQSRRSREIAEIYGPQGKERNRSGAKEKWTQR